MEENKVREMTDHRSRSKVGLSQASWLILKIFRGCCSKVKRKRTPNFEKEIIVVPLPAEEKAETNLLVGCEEAVTEN